MMNNQLDRVSVAQASKELNIDPLTLRYALRQGKLPIGFALYKKRYTYIIYRNKLDDYKEGK